jgi:hypothetical protein
VAVRSPSDVACLRRSLGLGWALRGAREGTERGMPLGRPKAPVQGKAAVGMAQRRASRNRRPRGLVRSLTSAIPRNDLRQAIVVE